MGGISDGMTKPRCLESRAHCRGGRLWPPDVPPLQSGDRLQRRAEFRRRYDAMPVSTKAELVEGIVYMPPHRI